MSNKNMDEIIVTMPVICFIFLIPSFCLNDENTEHELILPVYQCLYTGVERMVTKDSNVLRWYPVDKSEKRFTLPLAEWDHYMKVRAPAECPVVTTV